MKTLLKLGAVLGYGVLASVVAILLNLVLAPKARAESPVGMGTSNLNLDSTSCYTWSGGGAAWTRCSPNVVVVPAAPAPAPPLQIVYVPQSVPTPVAEPPKEKPPRKRLVVVPVKKSYTCGGDYVPTDSPEGKAALAKRKAKKTTPQ
jgi:hypothetical protein